MLSNNTVRIPRIRVAYFFAFVFTLAAALYVRSLSISKNFLSDITKIYHPIFYIMQ
jgi:hypothetical protein